MLPSFQDLLNQCQRVLGNRKVSKPSRRRTFDQSPLLESLESRVLLSVQSVILNGNQLVVTTDDSSTSVDVVDVSRKSFQVREVGTGNSWSVARNKVGTVEFRGGNGNDRFVNQVNTLSVRAYGGSGDDYLQGGGLGDYFEGGAGNDILLGMGGNDILLGQEGDDRLNGREGNDQLWGGSGNDVLISIDAGTGDYLAGENGWDTIWTDQVGTSTDTVNGVTSEDHLQYIIAFANGADRSLNGDRIADPAAKSGQSYKTFSNHTLFSTSGPSFDDIHQGYLGDCYFLAGLSAIAMDTPQTLRNNIVDFDDGTYGVKLGENFYRVDNDLPVYGSGSTNPAYAGFGQGGSMWVAVAEKAFAYARSGANSYASIEGGWGLEANQAFGADVIGNRSFSSYSSTSVMANEIYTQWSAHNAVTIGFLWTLNSTGASAPLIMSHMYTVISVSRDIGGNVTSLVLRNPWGVDGAGNDANRYDGLVTVTPEQIAGCYGRINWGHV